MTEEEKYERNIDFLTTEIIGNNCILFLGPGVFTSNNSTEPIISSFCNKLLKELGGKDIEKKKDLRSIIMLYLQDKLQNFLPEQKQSMKKVAIVRLLKNLKDFNEKNLFISDFHKKLSKMPFKLVVNVTPDEKLYKDLFQSYDFGVYDFSNDQKEKKPPSDISTNTIFYNLFGSFYNPLSIPVTESDFIKITTCFIKETPPIHSRVKNVLEEKDISFLFLGFDFNSWYLKVLINILKVKVGVNLENTFFPIPDTDKDFFTNEHNLSFISKDFDKFIDDIYEKITPELSPQVNNVKKRILLLFNNETDKAYAEEFESIMSLSANINHEDNITLGESNIDDKLTEALLDADLVVMLSSAAFFDSEISVKFLKMAEAKDKKIVNILLNSCPYEDGLRGVLENYPASIHKTLPVEKQAITQLVNTREQRETYFTKINEEIKKM